MSYAINFEIKGWTTLHCFASSPNPQVMNITDVDDKIIKRTVERLEQAGEPLDTIDTTKLTREMEALFWADMRALNVRVYARVPGGGLCG